MNEFERWGKIKPLPERFLKYAKYYRMGAEQKLKLIDVLNKDLYGHDYHCLVVGLALQGYIINFIEGSSKYKIAVGVESLHRYSYFKLEESGLRKSIDKVRNANRDIEEKLINKLKELDAENKKLKSFKKAGQKVFDNKEVITTVYNHYLSGKSLGDIATNLTQSGIKTKRGGSTWYKSTVKFILQNHDYVDFGYVNEEAFNLVQETLKRNRLSKSTGN